MGDAEGELGDRTTDAALDPFWAECERLGLFVFVHPALKLNHSQQFDGYDTARSVGREFSLVMATIRLINSGVFDRRALRKLGELERQNAQLKTELDRSRASADASARSTATHLSSIAIGVGSAVIPSVVRHGAVAGSRKCSA